jgi:hypothetical protein
MNKASASAWRHGRESLVQMSVKPDNPKVGVQASAQCRDPESR